MAQIVYVLADIVPIESHLTRSNRKKPSPPLAGWRETNDRGRDRADTTPDAQREGVSASRRRNAGSPAGRSLFAHQARRPTPEPGPEGEFSLSNAGIRSRIVLK